MKIFLIFSLVCALISTSSSAQEKNFSNKQWPTETEVKTLPPVTLEEFVAIAEQIKKENPLLDEKSPAFSRLVFNRIKSKKD